ncbi:unnamed protein product [Blepharisma stoltei]|uniref:Uncharacterized protein n=1 Tax=Blepharisma stoltei TaxID=1481888 RepID=A0AAU9IR34_9CILI|nr:unnamed protein product [Blepharisma stoltei]
MDFSNKIQAYKDTGIQKPRQRGIEEPWEWEIKSDTSFKLQIPDKKFSYPQNTTFSVPHKSVCVTERSKISYQINSPDTDYQVKKANYKQRGAYPYKYTADGDCIYKAENALPKIEPVPLYHDITIQTFPPYIQEVSSKILIDDNRETPYTQRKIHTIVDPFEISLFPEESHAKIEEIASDEEQKIAINEEQKIATNEQRKAADFEGNSYKIVQPKRIIENASKGSDTLFNITTYKTSKCSLGSDCTGSCNDYHFEGERRRAPSDFFYIPELCENIPNCKSGNSCTKSHNAIEIIYHPQMYLSHFCPYSSTSIKCVLGKACNFKHLEKKLKSKCPQEFLGKIFSEFDEENENLENINQDANGNAEGDLIKGKTKEHPMDGKRAFEDEWYSA